MAGPQTATSPASNLDESKKNLSTLVGQLADARIANSKTTPGSPEFFQSQAQVDNLKDQVDLAAADYKERLDSQDKINERNSTRRDYLDQENIKQTGDTTRTLLTEAGADNRASAAQATSVYGNQVAGANSYNDLLGRLYGDNLGAASRNYDSQVQGQNNLLGRLFTDQGDSNRANVANQLNEWIADTANKVKTGEIKYTAATQMFGKAFELAQQALQSDYQPGFEPGGPISKWRADEGRPFDPNMYRTHKMQGISDNPFTNFQNIMGAFPKTDLDNLAPPPNLSTQTNGFAGLPPDVQAILKQNMQNPQMPGIVQGAMNGQGPQGLVDPTKMQAPGAVSPIIQQLMSTPGGMQQLNQLAQQFMGQTNPQQNQGMPLAKGPLQGEPMPPPAPNPNGASMAILNQPQYPAAGSNLPAPNGNSAPMPGQPLNAPPVLPATGGNNAQFAASQTSNPNPNGNSPSPVPTGGPIPTGYTPNGLVGAAASDPLVQAIVQNIKQALANSQGQGLYPQGTTGSAAPVVPVGG